MKDDIKKPKVLILGYYGFRNTGDEAMLNALIKHLRAFSKEICVFSGDPKYTSTLHNVSSVKRSLKFPGIAKELLSRVRTIKQCDIMIIGGGSLFNDKWHIFPFGLYEATWCKIFGKKIIVCGVDVGPYNSFLAKIMAKLFFKAIDGIAVRTKGSSRELKKLKIENHLIATDLAFLNERGNKDNGKKLLLNNNIPVKNLVGVSLRHYKGITEKNISEIARSLDLFIQNTNANLLFIPFQYHLDIGICNKTINMMESRDKVYLWDRESDFREIIDIMSVLDFMIGMRLHSLIFSAINEVPFLGIAYHLKVVNFCKMFYPNMPYILFENILHTDFSELLLKTYKEKEKYKSILLNSLPLFKRKSKINITLIESLL